MVRRSSTTSRGTTYWFHCFSFPMSQLSCLRMRNFSDLMCLPKSREEKVTQSNEGKDKLVRLTWVIWGDPFPQPTPSKEYVLRTFPQFKVILFYARNLKLIYVGNLGTIIGAKLCHSVTLSRLNISYVDGIPVVQKS